MYCNKCGKELREGAGFCPECGARVESSPKQEKSGAKKALPFIIAGGAVFLAGLVLLMIFVIIPTLKGAGEMETPLAMAARLMDEGRYEEAILAYEDAISIDPYDPAGYLGCADAYSRLSRTEEAINVLRRALEVLPEGSSGEVKEALALLEVEEAPADPVPAPVTLHTEGETEEIYQDLLQNELIPAYGLADMEAIAELRAAVPEYDYGNTGALPKASAACEGLLAAARSDLDKDGVSELVCLLSEDVGNGETKLVKLMVFTCRDGKAVRLNGCEESVLGVIDGDHVRELTACFTDRGLIVISLGGHPDTAMFAEYSCYSVKEGTVIMTGDVFHMQGFYGEDVVYIYDVPESLTELYDLPLCLDSLEPAMNIYNKVMDTNGVSRVLYVRVDSDYREDWAKAYPDCASAPFPYTSVDEAVRAVVGDLEGDIIMPDMTRDLSGLHGETIGEYDGRQGEEASLAGYITSGTYTIYAENSGLVINLSGKTDASTDKDGTKVILWDATGSNMQSFRVSCENGNACRLFAMSSAAGRVLDVYRGNSSTLSAGMRIDLWSVSRDTDQQWVIETDSSGLSAIHLASDPSLVMTCPEDGKSGDAVTIEQYDGRAGQFWRFVEN